MGAWGAGPFENDDAADWKAELEREGAAALVSALSCAANPRTTWKRQRPEPL